MAKHKDNRKSLPLRGPIGGALPSPGSPYASTTPQEHKMHAQHSISCAVITVSDSKTEATDRGGPTIRAALERAGHTVAWSRVVRDELLEIRAALDR